MRICFLADAGSIHIVRWVQYFLDRGHEVHVISDRPFLNNAVKDVKLHLLRPMGSSGMTLLRYPMDFACNVMRVRRLLRAVKPDILHSHYVLDYGVLGALSRFRPFLLTAWGSDVLVAPRQSLAGRPRVKFAVSRADLILTTSDYLKTYVQNEFGLPEHAVQALPWGIDLKTFHNNYRADVEDFRSRLHISEGTTVVLSPRHLRAHYRIDHIVRAMKKVVESCPNTVLLVLKGAADDALYESEIHSLVAQLGLTSNIKVIRTHLSPHEMAAAYNAADVFISIPKADGFASSVMEGMYCGAIPIVADLEVYRQYLADGINAFFVDPENIQQIAEKIVHCIKHPELKRRFHEVNRTIIEQREDWDKNCRATEDLYQSLLVRKVTRK